MQLIDLSTISKRAFFYFVDKCNETYRSGHDLCLYRKLMSMHRQNANLDSLLGNSEFLDTIYRTLKEWDMNKRGAKLVPFETFKDSIRLYKDILLKLYKYKLYDDIYDEMGSVKKLAEKVFCNLQVMESKRRIVGLSKVLHFLYPDLIMPIDSKYTMTAFYGYNKYSSAPKKEFATFWEIVERTYDIVERLELSPDDVDGKLWNVSVPKLIDNAIIGLWKCEKDEILALFNTD